MEIHLFYMKIRILVQTEMIFSQSCLSAVDSPAGYENTTLMEPFLSLWFASSRHLTLVFIFLVFLSGVGMTPPPRLPPAPFQSPLLKVVMMVLASLARSGRGRGASAGLPQVSRRTRFLRPNPTSGSDCGLHSSCGRLCLE